MKWREEIDRISKKAPDSVVYNYVGPSSCVIGM